MMDPSKLDKMKVVELRAELQARGLDTKGVKAILVERLKSALESEVASAEESESSALPTDLSIQSAPSPAIQTTPGRRSRRTHSSTRSPSPLGSKKIEQITTTGTEFLAAGSSEGLEILPEEPTANDYTRETLTSAERVESAEKSKSKNPEKVVVKLKIEKYHDTYVAGRVEETPLSSYIEQQQHQQQLRQQQLQEHQTMRTPEKTMRVADEVKVIKTPAEKKIMQPMEIFLSQEQHQLQQQRRHTQQQEQQLRREQKQKEQLLHEQKQQEQQLRREQKQQEQLLHEQKQQEQQLCREQKQQEQLLHEQKQQLLLEQKEREQKQVEKSPEEKVEDLTIEQAQTERRTPEKQQKFDNQEKVKVPERKRFSDSSEEPLVQKSPQKSEIVPTPPEEVKDESVEHTDEQEEDVEEKEEFEKPIESEKMDVDNEKDETPAEKSDEVAERKASTEEDRPKEQVEERPSRKRPRSKSRSPSRSRSKSRSRSRSRSRSKSTRSHSKSKSRSRSRSRSPRRTQRKSPAPNIDDFTNEEDEPVVEDKQFALSWFDSDLHLRIDPVAFNSAKPLHEDVFGLVWSGARTNYGVREGKVVYEVRLSEEVPAENFRSEDHLLGFRAGFSLVNSGLLIGESENSFAYCSSGKKVVNGEFTEYGKTFKLDDVVGCYLDLEASPCKIHFTLNGEDLGTAFEFDKEILGENEALFPHVLTKGYEFQVNFADNENLLGNIERPTRRRKRERRSRSRSRSKSRSRSAEKRSSKENKVQPQQPQAADGGENWDEDVNMAENKPKEEKSDVNKSENGDDEKKEEDEQPADEKNEKIETDKDEDQTENEAKVENKDDSSSSSADKKKNEKSEVDEWEVIEPEPRDVVELQPGYQLIALIPEDQYIPGPQRPESRKECEVLLMVGLPGAGKTHWVQNYLKENPDKRYDIIGVDELVEKMKVDDKPRKECHSGKWEKVYDLCLKSLTTLEEIATKRRRNYILDQTNVFASDQRRKMKGFGDFKRIAVVCIPNEEEMKRRNDMINDTQGFKETLKESTLNRMKANFTLPSVEFGWFDEVRYTDLDGDEVKDEVKKYNEKGKKALEASEPSRYKRPRRDNYRRGDDRRRRDDRRRYDDRGSRWKGNDRRGPNNRWGQPGGGNRPGQWRDDRGYGGYDRRNDRYSSGSGGGGGWASYGNRRYDDRFYRPQGGGGSGGGGGGGSRYDYGSRDYGRDHRYDRDRNGSSSGSSSRRESSSSSHHRGGSQRDFRSGHRDNRSEDSRGGYERSSSSKHSSSDTYYNDHKNGRSGSSSSKSTNNASSNHQKSQWQGGNQHSSSQQQQHSQMQQIPQQQGWNTSTTGQQQASYWGYDPQNNYGAYGNHQQQQQQQWPINSADPRQQQQWMNWWQQQGGGNNNQQQHPQQQQYWAQYAYPQQQPQAVGGDGSGGHSDGARSDSKK